MMWSLKTIMSDLGPSHSVVGRSGPMDPYDQLRLRHITKTTLQ